MSGKKKRGSARAVPRSYGRLTRHERDTVQRMLERRASCREIARELGRSPSTVSAEVASHRFVTAPKARRGERVDASADLSAACPRLAAWPVLSIIFRKFSQLRARQDGTHAPIATDPACCRKRPASVSNNVNLGGPDL